MLEADVVYIWRVALGDSVFLPGGEAQSDAWYRGLSAEERRRADGFRGAGLRSDYIRAHAALRQILGACLGIPAAAVCFEAVAGAGAMPLKPAIQAAVETASGLVGGFGRGRSAGADLRFNLSHTGGAALIGVALGREIGIDIERQRPMEDLEGMARSVMSERELARWKGMAGEDRQLAFYHLWTRKESYLKAIGLGLYHPLDTVTVPVSAHVMDAALGRFAAVEDGTRKGIWMVADVAVEEGYSASVCCEGAAIPSVVVRNWESEGFA